MSSIVPPIFPDILVIAVGLPASGYGAAPLARRDPTARRTTSPRRYTGLMYVYGRNPASIVCGSLRTRCRSIFEAVTFPESSSSSSRSSFRPLVLRTHHVDHPPASDDCSSSPAGASPSATPDRVPFVATRRPIHLDPVTETIEKKRRRVGRIGVELTERRIVTPP